MIWNEEGLPLGIIRMVSALRHYVARAIPRGFYFGSGGVLPTLITTLIRLGVEMISVNLGVAQALSLTNKNSLLGWLDFEEDTYQAPHGCDTVINALPRSASLSLVERIALDLPRAYIGPI